MNSSDVEDVSAWREVRGQLMLAIQLTQDSISAEKAKRRFLLEEIYLNVEQDGKLKATSTWIPQNSTKKKKSGKKEVSLVDGTKSKNSKKARPLPSKASAVAAVTKKSKKKLKISMRSTKEAKAKKVKKLLKNPSSQTPASTMSSVSQYEVGVSSLTGTNTKFMTHPPAIDDGIDDDDGDGDGDIYNFADQFLPQDQESMHSHQSGVSAYNDGSITGSAVPMDIFQTSLESTAAAVAVASQVALQAFGSSSPISISEPSGITLTAPASTSDFLFQELLQQQGVDDEEEEDAF